MILITRPIESSKKLQATFKKLGLDSYIKPLTSIVINKKQYYFESEDIYIVTSQYAVKFLKLQKNFNKKLLKFKFLVIGHSTASKLMSIGAHNILFIAENSKKLLQHIKQKKYSENLTYICGSNHNHDFVNDLVKNKKKIKFREAYKVLSNETLSKKILNELEKDKIKIILIFSLVNAELFLETCLKYELNLDKYTYVCMSKKIAKYMQSKSCKNVTYSTKSTLEDMIKKTRLITKKYKKII